MITLTRGEDIAIAGTSGNILSIYDHADVKLIPAAKDVLGNVNVNDGVGNPMPSFTSQPTNQRGLDVYIDSNNVLNLATGQSIIAQGSASIAVAQSATSGALQVQTGKGIANSIIGSGSVISPGLGATIASAVLVASTAYLIDCTVSIGATVANVDDNNMRLTVGTATVTIPIDAPGVVTLPTFRATPSSTVFNVKAIAAGTANAAYGAFICATQAPA